ncbi:chemotaxis protein CheW [Deinococcus peraridilitoris]|uniref:Chemotaxis signal transduction protein n=1 Tax=Deinococcus peraridilitoris (strain DSM 19664 / LMG 22246 / CIP 109416 / KR-200) TaxID=937777 RepID=K9ZYL5_DEIPD|nr:chemotaxis protein CheW [Deinococcus peraridilitoris]AFZ65850.1 chemotaxis signal transduction protein [Deinococcus peraridilitoris DSM 19664]
MGDTARALLVRLGERTFALSASSARGVVALERITTVPRASELLLGLIPVRGGIVPLVDLHTLLGAGSTHDVRRPDARAVVADVEGNTFAFPVDDVLGFGEIVTEAQPHEMSAPPVQQLGHDVEALNPVRVMHTLAQHLNS